MHSSGRTVVPASGTAALYRSASQFVHGGHARDAPHIDEVALLAEDMANPRYVISERFHLRHPGSPSMEQPRRFASGNTNAEPEIMDMGNTHRLCRQYQDHAKRLHMEARQPDHLQPARSGTEALLCDAEAATSCCKASRVSS